MRLSLIQISYLHLILLHMDTIVLRPFEDADLPEVVALFLACEPALNMGTECALQASQSAITSNGAHTQLWTLY